MNENIDLTKILKDCPKGTKLYSSILGNVTLVKVYKGATYPIIVYYNEDSVNESFTADGKIVKDKGECVLFPSKDQRDWKKFNVPWSKKEKFDPKTLKPFDRVLVSDMTTKCWRCALFSHINYKAELGLLKYVTAENAYIYCIPYNDETKHLVGTSVKAPKYYRYWDD